MNTGIESISERNAHRFAADSIARALEVLGDRWTFLILRESFFGVRRYGQLARNLKCSRTILSDRLNRLVDAGVLERHRYRREPDRYEYRLTEVGRDLYPAIVALMHWGDTYLAGSDGAPLVLNHRKCGRDTTPAFVCSECGERLNARDIDPRPGPGAHS